MSKGLLFSVVLVASLLVGCCAEGEESEIETQVLAVIEDAKDQVLDLCGQVDENHSEDEILANTDQMISLLNELRDLIAKCDVVDPEPEGEVVVSDPVAEEAEVPPEEGATGAPAEEVKAAAEEPGPPAESTDS